MSKVISVVSGKGGVGKTTFSINLAAALYEFEQESVVVDADISNPNIALYLGLSHIPITLQDVLNDNANISHAIQVHPTGLKVVPAALSMDKGTANFSRLKEVLTGLNDLVIVDSPPGLNDDIQAILDASDKIIVVTNPEVPAVTDAVKTIRAAKNMGKYDIGIVINRVKNNSYELTRDEVEIMCEAPILATISEDENIRKSSFENLLLIHRNPYSHASIDFRHLAARLLKMQYIPPRFLFLKRILNR